MLNVSQKVKEIRSYFLKQASNQIKEFVEQSKTETINQARLIIAKDIYEYINISEDLQPFICYICTEPVQDPINCDQCDQITCGKCIKPGMKCPHCGKPNHSRSKLHRMMLVQSEKFQQNLESKHQLCETVVLFREQEKHICEKGYVECPFCQKNQKASSVKNHIEDHEKPKKCEYCDVEIGTLEDQIIHQNFAMDCKNKQLERKNEIIQQLSAEVQEQKQLVLELQQKLEVSEDKNKQNEEQKNERQPLKFPEQAIEIKVVEIQCVEYYCTDPAEFLNYLIETKTIQDHFTGVVKCNRQNGTKHLSIECKGGKPHGKYIEWFENGNKSCEQECKDGKEHGKYIEWNENGNKWREIEYKDGKEHGKYIEWFENGNKSCEQEYKDGKEHGKYIEWYENGKKYRESEYKDGYEHGKYIEWYEDGNKWFEKEYKDGELIK